MRFSRVSVGLLLAASAPLASEGETVLFRAARAAPEVEVEAETDAALEEGSALFRRVRSDQLIIQFSNERYDKVGRLDQIDSYVAQSAYEELFLAGDDAFAFEADNEFGAREDPAPVHVGALGGADGASCRGCHFGGGPDGGGTSSQRALTHGDGAHFSSAAVRDAPHVMGLGYVSKIAREMEAALHATRLQAEDTALTTDVPVVFPLEAKGVSFGELVALPGGTVDTSGVVGISHDLVVRPFGHKGRHADLVEFVDEAIQIHHGIQTASRVTMHAGEPDIIGDGPDNDPDRDGARVAGVLSSEAPGAELPFAHSMMLAAYMALIGVPEIHAPKRPDLLDAWAQGRALLDRVGCTSCHREQMWIEDDVLEIRAPGSFEASFVIPLLSAGQEPRPRRTDFGYDTDPSKKAVLFLYSDLKRHDLGAPLAEAKDEELPDGSVVPASVWVTRPLWGLADTAPYMADGRAATVHEAILLHEGEARAARDAYLSLSQADQGALRAFLLSLTRDPVLLVE